MVKLAKDFIYNELRCCEINQPSLQQA